MLTAWFHSTLRPAAPPLREDANPSASIDRRDDGQVAALPSMAHRARINTAPISRHVTRLAVGTNA
jgi:hypothetical protein